jgi:hypothetical protein
MIAVAECVSSVRKLSAEETYENDCDNGKDKKSLQK